MNQSIAEEDISATLSIEMNVECPNEECCNYINLLDSSDTNEYEHNDCGELLRQMFSSRVSHSDFECEGVTCSRCKTTFDVKGLEW